MGLIERDSKSIVRSDAIVPIEVKTADGVILKGADGRSYIDFLSGWCVVNAGWGRKEIMDVLHKFSEPAYTFPTMLYEGWVELAELLVGIAPVKQGRCLRATGGSEAVEMALQCAIAKTGRHSFLSFDNPYHGHTLAELSISEMTRRRRYIERNYRYLGAKQIPLPFDPLGKKDDAMVEKSMDALRRDLKSNEYAAFIFEPISMNHAAMVPPKEFYYAAREECERSGTMMIADEVACGFGRTGKLFACEHYGLEPDVVTVAKGMSSGYAPIGATIARKELADAMRPVFYSHSTFGWTPLATRIALANIGLITKERLWENAEKVGRHMLKRIGEIRDERIAGVRGKGLAIGVTLSSDGRAIDADLGARVAGQCMERGLIVGASMYGLMLYPPLIMDEKTAEKGIEIFEAALRSSK